MAVVNADRSCAQSTFSQEQSKGSVISRARALIAKYRIARVSDVSRLLRDIAPAVVWGCRAFVSSALLTLFPGMGENSDRS